jgi:hypothetical protein
MNKIYLFILLFSIFSACKKDKDLEPSPTPPPEVSVTQGWDVVLKGSLTPLTIIYDPIIKIKFQDEQHGFALSPKGMFKTTDGGNTWVQNSTPFVEKFPNETIKLIDVYKDTLYVLSDFRLYKSGDYGNSWKISELPSGTSAASFYDLMVLDFNKILIKARFEVNNMIYDALYSEDGGKSYQNIYDNKLYEIHKLFRLQSGKIVGIGYQSVYRFDEITKIETVATVPVGSGYAFQYVTDDVWYRNTGGNFFKTIDGMQTWETLNLNLPNSFQVTDYIFTDSSKCFLLLDGSKVYYSGNKGKKFDIVYKNIDEPISQAHFCKNGNRLFLYGYNDKYSSSYILKKELAQ